MKCKVLRKCDLTLKGILSVRLPKKQKYSLKILSDQKKKKKKKRKEKRKPSYR